MSLLFGDLSDKNDVTELLKYQKDLLKALSIVPSLQESLEDAYFVKMMLDVGKEYFLESQINSLEKPVFFLTEVLAANRDTDLQIAAGNLQATLENMPMQDSTVIPQAFYEDVRDLAQIRSNPGISSGLEPWIEREDPYKEAQRRWALQAIAENAEYICEVANHYGLTAHAIAGAILWEALENPYLDHPFVGRGEGPLQGTRPGDSDDFGILGKIHVGVGEVSWNQEVLNRVGQRRPDGLPDLSDLTVFEDPLGFVAIQREYQHEILLIDNEQIAIEYIGAILDYRRDFYEDLYTRFGYDINLQDQTGLLTTLYQGGLEDNPDRIASIEDRLARGDTQPRLPETEKMGPWNSEYRWFIAYLLELHGCVQGEGYSRFEDLI